MSIYIASRLSAQERKASIRTFLNQLGRISGTTFLFEGTPKTDGKTVWLGNISPVDPNFEIFALGHGIHEMMHVNETEMSVLSGISLNNIEKTLLNVLEDIRIDSLGNTYYANYKNWRTQLCEALSAQGTLAIDQQADQLHPSELLALWIHSLLLSDLGFSFAEKPAARLKLQIQSQTSANLVHLTEQIARKIHKVTSTAESLALAKQICALWKNEAEILTSVKKDSSKEPDLFSEFSDSNDFFINQAIDAPTVLNFTDNEFPSAQQDDAQSSSSGYSDLKASLRVIDWPDQSDSTQLKRDAKEFSEYFAKEKTHLANLTSQFSELLRTEAETSSSQTFGQDLDPDFINQLAVKSPKIFISESSQTRPEASVVILLDRSGSMGVEKMTKAKVAVCALELALRHTPGVQSRLAVFPGPDKTHVALVSDRQTKDEVLRKRIEAIGSFGATPIREALQWAIQCLSQDREPLKIIILLTDGVFPASIARPLLKEMQRIHCEFAVMNIDTDNETIVENTVTIRNCDEIDKALLTLVKCSNAYNRLTKM